MKIGVFDSGYGGLSVLKHFLQELPEYDYVYLGDNARAPYGPRGRAEVTEFTRQAIDFFAWADCSLVIVACNTANALAVRWIQQQYLPAQYPAMKVLGVLIPAAEAAAEASRSGRIGVMATIGSVESGSFVEEIEKLRPEARVYQVACPQLVPLIESGRYRSAAMTVALDEYTSQLTEQAVDTVILGCTHYELIADTIKAQLPDSTNVVSEGGVVADKLRDYLLRHPEVRQRLQTTGRTRQYYTSGDARDFAAHAEVFLGQPCAPKTVGLDRE